MDQMNWIICPVRNNLSLTKEAVRTFRAQDIEGGVHILIIDNGSTDGTGRWLSTQRDIFTLMNRPGMSVAASWNRGLEFAFESFPQELYALVVNNDVELRPDTYRHLVADGGPFVTAVGVRDREKLLACPDPDPDKKRPHPDFSCYLIRRETYHVVGAFDENFKIAFCEDWDYHLRMQKVGIRAEALELPFLHHASQTVKNADNAERDRIMKQAEANREYFYQKWGVRGGTQEYYDLFQTTAPAAEEESTP
jgi:GT2 family glycosyltransferase